MGASRLVRTSKEEIRKFCLQLICTGAKELQEIGQTPLLHYAVTFFIIDS